LPRARSATVAALLAALVAAAGCGGESTGVLLRVQLEDPALGARLDELRVVAVGRDAAGAPQPTVPPTQSYRLTAVTTPWPQSVAILAGARSTAGVDVLVVGLGGGIEVARGGALVTFASGSMADATVTLRTACRGVNCDAGAFCGEGGQCAGGARRLDFAVNAGGGGEQTSPVVASLGGAGWVVAWVDEAVTPAQVFMRRFGPDGVPLDTADFQIAASDFKQVSPALAADATANVFVAAWAEVESGRVRVRRFHPSAQPLSPLGEAEAPSGAGSGAQTVPALGANPFGFILAWQDTLTTTGSGTSIRYRRGRWDAAWIDSSVAYAATSPTGAEQLPAACGSCGGPDSFLVAWQDANMADPDPSGIQIRGRWLSGTPATGGESVLDTTTAGDQVTPAAASNSTMGAVFWEDRGAAPPAIRGRICTPGSTALSAEITPSFTAGAARPAVGVAGNVAMVVWEAPDPEGSDLIVVLGRRVLQSGDPVDDDAFPLAAGRAGKQQLPRVAGSDDGTFAIVWQEYDPEAAGWEIRGRILGAAEKP
jgi:hypothetical protein